MYVYNNEGRQVAEPCAMCGVQLAVGVKDFVLELSTWPKAPRIQCLYLTPISSKWIPFAFVPVLQAHVNIFVNIYS